MASEYTVGRLFSGTLPLRFYPVFIRSGAPTAHDVSDFVSARAIAAAMERNHEIEKILKRCLADVAQSSQALIKAVLHRGGSDNVSVIVTSE